MKPMTHEEIQELLGAYALDAVDPDEAEVVELHLAELPPVPVGGGGPSTRWPPPSPTPVATPRRACGIGSPDSSRRRRRRCAWPSPTRPRHVIPLAPRRRRANRLVLSALGAAAALAIAVLGAQVVRQQDELDRFEAAIQEGSLLSAAEVALQDPSASKAKLQSFNGEITGQAVVLPERHRVPARPRAPRAWRTTAPTSCGGRPTVA